VAFPYETGDGPARVGVAGPGPHPQHVAGLPAHAHHRRQAGLALVAERGSFLTQPVGGHIGGVGIDGDQPRLGTAAHGPGPGQHRPVHRRGPHGSAQIGTRAEPPQCPLRRQHVPAPQPLIGRPPKQGPVRHDIAAGQDHFHHRPIALSAAVAARADRPQQAPVGLINQPQPVQQRSPQRRPRDAGDQIIGLAHLDRRRFASGTVDDLSSVEQRDGRVPHQTGAFRAVISRASTLRMIPKRKAFVAHRTRVRVYSALSG